MSLMPDPINVAGSVYFAIEEIDVVEYHELEDGKGEPQKVHLIIAMENEAIPFVMRFHSPSTLDELIVALITHRRGVWGK